jgi:hypothetical protein
MQSRSIEVNMRLEDREYTAEDWRKVLDVLERGVGLSLLESVALKAVRELIKIKTPEEECDASWAEKLTMREN